MGQIEGTIAKSQRSLNAMAPAAQQSAAALAAAGTAVGAVGLQSIRSYSDIRRFEIGLESLVGRHIGHRLAREALEFGAASAYSNTEVMRQVQFLLAMGTAADKVMPRIRALSNLVAMAGGNTETFSRAALAIGQIQAAGVLRGQELRQLTEAGIPVSRLAKAMGMSMNDVLKSEGSIPADRVLAAIEKLGLGQGDVQGRLAAEVPMVRLANIVDRVNLVLAPTGRALNSFLAPLLYVTDVTLLVAQRFNEVTHGLPSLLLLLGITYKVVQGFIVMRKSLVEATVGLTALARTSATAAAAQAVQTATQAGTFPGLGNYGTSAGGILAPVAAIATQQATKKASVGWMGKALAWIGARIGLGVAGRLGGAAVANAVPVIGQIVSAGLIAWTIYDVIKAGQEASDAIKETGADMDRSRQNPVTRPHQRSDIENMQQRIAFGY